MMSTTAGDAKVAAQRQRSGEGPDPTPTDVVVVAVDGSEPSVAALVWALRHAGDRGLKVEALTAWPLHGAVFVREVAGHFCEPRWRAREVQAQAVARALAAVDDAPACDLRVVNADLTDALARTGGRASVLVIGSDRPAGAPHGALVARVLASVAVSVVVVAADGVTVVSRTQVPPEVAGHTVQR